MKRPLLGLLITIMGLLACNAGGSSASQTPATRPTDAPAVSIPPTAVLTTEALPPTPDSAAFESGLRSALASKDFAQLEQSMGDAFLMQYTGGANGLITVNDAVTLLRDSLLAGSASVTFDDSVDASAIEGADLTSVGFDVTDATFSRGWGEAGLDHALVLIGLNEASEPYFAGLIYSRGGFAGIATATLPADSTEAAPSPTAAAAPDPAPRGPSVYVSDFKQGWWEHEANNVKTEHTAEGYGITVGNGPNGGWSFTTQVERADFYAEVTTEPLECPSANGAYGLLFHYQDDTHFHFFIIWCNGKYSLMERTAATTAAVLIEGDLPASIDPASGEHRIGILAQDSTLAMYVDDIRLGAIGVPTMPAGDIGPYVQTLGRETVSILFTRITIYETE
jgi:hypothetical protein